MRDARRLMGFAISHEPQTLYHELGEPTINEQATVATKHILEKFTKSMGQNPERDLLFYGLADTAQILMDIFKRHSNIDQDLGMRIALHPDTTNALAKLARHPESVYGTLLNTNPSDGIIRLEAAEGNEHIAVSPPHQLFPYRNGCPAVTVESGPKPSPIFKRFVPWAGELAVLSYFDHKQ